MKCYGVKVKKRNRKSPEIQNFSHPFHVFPKRLTVTGSQNLKLNMRVRAFSSEVHLSGQSTDTTLREKNPEIIMVCSLGLRGVLGPGRTLAVRGSRVRL